MGATQPFAVFDIDGTIFRWQLYHAVITELISKEHLPRSVQAEIAPLLAKWHNRDHKNAWREYEMAVVGVAERHLPGIAQKIFEDTAKYIVERDGNKVYTYTRDLIESLHKQGYALLAVSSSFEELVEAFAKKYGFLAWRGARNIYQDGRLISTDNAYAYNNKSLLLKELVERYNLTWEDSIGVGDTKGDIAMLELVEKPIAFNPNKELFDHAARKGWNIVVERKNVVYKLRPRDGNYVLEI